MDWRLQFPDDATVNSHNITLVTKPSIAAVTEQIWREEITSKLRKRYVLFSHHHTVDTKYVIHASFKRQKQPDTFGYIDILHTTNTRKCHPNMTINEKDCTLKIVIFCKSEDGKESRNFVLESISKVFTGFNVITEKNQPLTSKDDTHLIHFELYTLDGDPFTPFDFAKLTR